MKATLYFLTIILWTLHRAKSNITQPVPSANLHKCAAWGDPAVAVWHPSNQPPPTTRVCQQDGMYELMRNNYLTLSVRVRPLGYMVELTANFFNGTSKKTICSMVSDNFHIDPSDGCDRYGISHAFIQMPTEWALLVQYPRAQFTAIITHNPQSGPSHFVTNIWQPADIARQTTGMCSTGLCSSHRLAEDNFHDLNRVYSLSQAKGICQIYYNTYVDRLSRRRATALRNARYNGTIAVVLDQCIFDVRSTGSPSAALSGMEVLMVEEVTTDAITLRDIEVSFQTRVAREIDELAAAIEEAQVKVNQYLAAEVGPVIG